MKKAFLAITLTGTLSIAATALTQTTGGTSTGGVSSGGTTGGTTGGTGTVPTTGTGSTGGSTTGGSTSSTGNTTSSGQGTNSQTGTKGVQIRSSWMSPVNKVGTFSPYNKTTTTSKSGTSGQSGSSRLSGLSTLGGLSGRSGSTGLGSQFGSGTTGSTTTSSVRVPVRVVENPGVPAAVARPSFVNTTFQSRVPRLPGLETVKSVSMVVTEGTAVLKGTVVSQDQRAMLERLALLEPGISAVQNELRVVAPGSTPELLPSASDSRQP